MTLLSKTSPLSVLTASAQIHADITGLIEIFPDGIIFLDRNWRITFANESARKISRIEPH